MHESILVNGVWLHLNEHLHTDDTLTIRIQENECSEKIPPTELPLNIIYEDEDILVINKPAGMPIHPSQNYYYNSLANALAWYYEQQGKPFIFRCTNRLDRDTSGLTIIAKHMVSSSILSQMVREHTISREYRAIVRGSVTPPCGTIDAPLSRKPGSIIERTVDFEHGERAVTHYQVLEEKNGHSLVSLYLETGRTHQIRVHMQYAKHPLVGDPVYNSGAPKDADANFGLDRQFLHSFQVGFTQPMTGEDLFFADNLTDDLAAVLDQLASRSLGRTEAGREVFELLADSPHPTAPVHHLEDFGAL